MTITTVLLVNMIIGSVNAAVIKNERSLERIQFNQHQFPLDEKSLEHSFRPKRALVFRPLFVYKEQEIRRIKLKEERKKRREQMQG